MAVKTFQVQSNSSSNNLILNIFNHPNHLVVKLYIFEWLCNMLYISCLSTKKLSLMEIMYVFMFIGLKKAEEPNLIQLAH